jgi:hypothetical protein
MTFEEWWGNGHPYEAYKHVAKTAYNSRDAEIESLRQQLDWVRNILASHGYDGPLGDGCCPLADWLNERESLRQQLTDSQKQVTLLQKGILAVDCLINNSSGVVELHHNGDIAEWGSLRTGGQFESWLVEFDEALAATTDLDGLILCDAEPVAWQTFDGEGGYDYRSYEDNEDYRDDYIKRNSSQKFYENWVIPLYRAWEPKL